MNEASAQTRRVQKIVGEILIPEVRALQDSTQFPQARTLPLALELYYVALSAKATHRPALALADRACDGLGLNQEDVYAYAVARIQEADRDL